MKTIKISVLLFAGLFAGACHNANTAACRKDSATTKTTSDIITTSPAAKQAGSAATDTISSATLNGATHNRADGKTTASGAKMKSKHHPYDGTLPQSSPYSKKEMQQAQAGMGADNTASGVTENATNVVPSKTSPNGVKVITK